jgi:hypothetical protein
LHPGNPTANGQHRQQPCWQLAGVSHSAVEQRRQIAESAHSEIESVCSNSSLTAQQKQAQIRQIREQARSRMDALVSQAQMQQIKSCREQRGIGTHSVPHSGSPCGELSGSNPVNSRPRGATTPGNGSQTKTPAANEDDAEDP